MTLFPDIPATASADQAVGILLGGGWHVVGEGDWATALADPADEWAARVVAFDPAYRIFADDCLAGPPNRWLPRIERILPLARDGYVVLMERLWPADATLAGGFCAALGIANNTGYEAPDPVPGPYTDDPDLAALKSRIETLMAAGAARYHLWGGSDIRPGNVMQTRAGELRLLDPLGIAGPKIVAAIRAGDAAALADFTRGQLEDFLTIAAFRRAEENPDPAGGLRRLLDALPLGLSGSPAPAGPE